MAISYNRMWNILVGEADLLKASGVSQNTMTKMYRDEEVTLVILGCNALDCDFRDIMSYIADKEPFLL